jgi:hypothetical protein
MNRMREVILLSSARKPDVDFDNVRVLLGGEMKKTDSKIHG